MWYTHTMEILLNNGKEWTTEYTQHKSVSKSLCWAKEGRHKKSTMNNSIQFQIQLIYNERKEISCSLGPGTEEGEWMQRDKRNLLGVMEIFWIFMVTSRLYTIIKTHWNIYSRWVESVLVNYTLIKLIKTKPDTLWLSL